MLLLLVSPIAAHALTVVRTLPTARSLTASRDTPIVIEFDRSLLASSVSAATLWAFGRWSGPAQGSLELSGDGRTVTLQPGRRFAAGETVTVFLSRDLRAADGSTLRREGYCFQFWTRSLGIGFDFRESGRFSTRSSPGISTRAYGGLGADLNRDGLLDVTIVNEDTNDLRSFMNRRYHPGVFGRFRRPPARVGAVPSPSEASDFDRDGNVDVVVANTRDETVSILLGDGRGRFPVVRSAVVGEEPRGIAVLDADGDGDVDIAATSFAEGRVTVLLNDGRGRFDETRSFGTGGGERALAAGDMDGDGILDLVVGDLTAGEVRVYAGAGDAEYRLTETRSSGGETWMLGLGDVDGDGDEDVTVVNSASNNAAVLFGDGAGGLSEPFVTATDDFPLATDLGDLDGDGDLDWVTSSFFGDWQLFENTGGGAFRPAVSFAAPAAASCSIPMDLDVDGVLDLVLIDELADEVVLMQSRALLLASDFESGDTAAWSRTRGRVAVVSPGLGDSAHALEASAGEGGSPAFVESRLVTAERSLDLEFGLDVGRLDLAGGEVEVLRLGKGRGEVVLKLGELRDRFRLRLLVHDRRTLRTVGDLTIRSAAPVRLRLEWSSASGASRRDGRVSLTRRDGELGFRAFKLANHGASVGRVRLGLLGGSLGDASGSLRFDEVTIAR